jgi:hypothetical protein
MNNGPARQTTTKTTTNDEQTILHVQNQANNQHMPRSNRRATHRLKDKDAVGFYNKSLHGNCKKAVTHHLGLRQAP